MEEPPILQSQPATGGKVLVGRLGLCFSVAALGALLMLWLGKPG